MFAQRRALCFRLPTRKCYVEVIGFFVNIFQLMLYLLSQMKILTGLIEIICEVVKFFGCDRCCAEAGQR